MFLREREREYEYETRTNLKGMNMRNSGIWKFYCTTYIIIVIKESNFVCVCVGRKEQLPNFDFFVFGNY